MRAFAQYSLAAATLLFGACEPDVILVPHEHPVYVAQPSTVVVVHQPPPPPLRVEVIGHEPYPHAVWTRGHWYWTHHHYVWVHGYWH